MNPGRWKNAVLLVSSVILTLTVFEVGARLLVVPCKGCWGTLLGADLPPFSVIPPDAYVRLDRTEIVPGLIVDGVAVTTGDLWGITRDDPVLGFAPQEGTASVNGWWQSNNIGARSQTDVRATKEPDTYRVLTFGDSFTNGSRVRMYETWPFLLGQADSTFDVVNLAVDGYSMAQAYLRYKSVRDWLEYDAVILGFAPAADLERDVNVLRSLMSWGGGAVVMPRYVIRDDRLELVKGLYATFEEARRANEPSTSPELVAHLRKYDARYVRSRYESPPIVGALITYKLLARLDFRRRYDRLELNEMHVDKEAAGVSQAIFRAMADDVGRDGADFTLAVIPTYRELDRFRLEPEYVSQWNSFVSFACQHLASCIDLKDSILPLPPDSVDSGYDGTHFGPNVNGVIAKALHQHLDGRRSHPGKGSP